MMQSDKRGGRSSATRSEGAPTPRGAAGSQNSPPPFALPETAQEKAGAFSKRRSRISVDNYFSHFVHAPPKTAAGKQRSSPANHRVVASSELLACRSLCHYAQLHPFVLRAEYCSRPTPKSWIAYWKNHVTRAWPRRAQIPIWQRVYWDRQLRRSESYGEKWHYVENNPVRHGKANSMCWSGTTHEHGGRSSATPNKSRPTVAREQRLAGARPSIRD